MKKRRLLIGFLLLELAIYAQTGPGGVGSSTDNVIWLKADAGTNTTTNGANITSWTDQSGNGNSVSQSTVNQQPVYQTNVINGMPTILFDNTATTNDFLLGADSPTLDNTSGLSFFTVSRPLNLDNSTARAIISKRNGVDTEESYMLFYWTSGDKFHTDIQTTNNRVIGNTTMTSNTNYILDVIYDGTLTAANRTKIYIGESLDKVGAETSASVPDNASPLLIGALNISDGRPFGGHIAEVIQFRRAVNDAERIIINNYLSAKYNISTSGNDKYAGDNAGNGNFDFDVAGVGQESTGSNTTFAASVTKGIKLTVNSGLDNGDYVMLGNKTTTNSQNTSDVGGMSGTNNARWERIWYIDVTNGSTALSVDIEFDFSDAGMTGSPAGTNSNYVLLYRATNSGNWTELATANSLPGDRVKFNGYALANDGYYTLGSKNFTASPLPISLLNFKAEKEKKSTLVEWTTVSETNNHYFTLERSADAIDYLEIGKIDSKAINGNSSNALSYEFTDATPMSGMNYYRLKQTDYNGQSKVFAPVSVMFGKDKNISFVLYPNPNKGEFIIDFSGVENNHEIKIELLSVDGKVVYSHSFYNEDSSHGSFEIIPQQPLMPGQYIVHVNVEGILYSLKTIVQ